MLFYKLLSVLLEYPANDTYDHLDELAEAVSELPVEAAEKAVLHDFITWCQGQTSTELQARYVETFDLTPDQSLHLTHHLFEEQDPGRGDTLVTLKEFFRHEGFIVSGGELPDYLPLILEFVSAAQDLGVARSLLEQSAPALEEVTRVLTAKQSPWAPLLSLIERHLDPSRHASAALA